MSAPQRRPVPKYTVTSVVPETEFSPNGQTVPSQRVSFTTESGITGFVLVPDTQINDIAATRALVEGRIMALSDIMNLGS
jgi:hypothetical protein